MIDVVQQTLFDTLVQETHELLREKEQLEAQFIDVVVRIGQNLIQMRPHKLYGQFLPWVNSEFGISPQTAHNYIHVAEVYGDNAQRVVHLPLRVVYELAAPTTSEEIREQVETQQIPATIPAIREAKQEAQRETFPPGFGLVNGKPFDMPLPDGKPVEIPDDWKLPASVRTPNTYEGGSTVRTPVEIDRGTHDEYPLPVVNRGVPAALQSSDSNEWYTPADYVDAARELMGDIDVDPASCELANQVIKAKKYYTKKDNGLMQSWANRVWLNPPYGFDSGTSNQEIWTHQLIERYKAGLTTEAVLLVNANTEAKWFHPLYEFLICFTHHRIRFYNTSGESSQPTQGNALVYFGKNEARFIEIFSRFGVVVRRADGR